MKKNSRIDKLMMMGMTSLMGNMMKSQKILDKTPVINENKQDDVGLKFHSGLVHIIAIVFLLIATPVIAAPVTTEVPSSISYFTTAEKAADKLYEGIVAKDGVSIKSLFGEEYLHLLPLDEVDELDRLMFIKAWDKSHKLVAGEQDELFVEVGTKGWTFPVPLIKNVDGWYFDVLSGLEIIRIRAIGRNELSTIQASLAYYDAQKEYAEVDRNANGRLEYAQKFISTAGQKDGLYWETEMTEPLSPLGALYSSEHTDGIYHGYHYKIIKKQGENARGGAYDYVKNNHMIYGFALLAWPAEYGETGVMSFIINQDGIIYDKNLGADTAKLAAEINSFDPGSDWEAVDDISL